MQINYDNKTFVRPHHSHIVNRNFIQEIMLSQRLICF